MRYVPFSFFFQSSGKLTFLKKFKFNKKIKELSYNFIVRPSDKNNLKKLKLTPTLHSKLYWFFLNKFKPVNSQIYMKSIFDKNFKIILPTYFLRKFRIFQKYHEFVWTSLFTLFYYCDWFLFEKMVRRLFDDTRLDRHGRIFKFVFFFFKKFPYYSSNIYYICLKVKGKMSRKGTARKRTIYTKRYFFENEGIEPTYTLSKYYFLIVARTGCTCFLGFIKQNH